MTNPPTTIRHAQLTDLAELMTLFVDTISTICKNDYNPEQIRVWTASAENTPRWTEKLMSQHFLVALHGNRITGFASLENNDYLDFLYVHKHYQRRGIANRLYEQIEATAVSKGAKELFSNVSKTARPFFESKGFMVVQRQVNRIQGVEIVNYRMRKQF